MRKIGYKLTSVLLALTLMVGLLPTVVWAESVGGAANLPEVSRSAADTGDTVPEFVPGVVKADTNFVYPEVRLRNKKLVKSPAASLPALYDSGDMNHGSCNTPVRNQGANGLCWAFAAISTMETNINRENWIKNGFPEGGSPVANLNLSEQHLAFSSYSSTETYGDDFTFHDNPQGVANEEGPGEGGNRELAAAYMMRGTGFGGAVPESADPYDVDFSNTVYDRNWVITDEGARLGSLLYMTARDYFLDPSDYLPDAPHGRTADITEAIGNNNKAYTAHDIVFMNGNDKMVDSTALKRAIMEYGAVGASMYWDGTATAAGAGNANTDYYNYANSAYYFNENRTYEDDEGITHPDVNHDVSIEGWWDNYPKENFQSEKQPSANGAWLVKNSWGKEWGGVSGYVWISYEDTNFPVGAYYYNDTAPYDPDKKVYETDYRSMGERSMTLNADAQVMRIFKAERENEELTAVRVMLNEGATVRVDCFVKPEVSLVTGLVSHGGGNVNFGSGVNLYAFSDYEFSSKGSITATYPGWYTIELENPVPLEEGQTFCVAVRYDGNNDTTLLMANDDLTDEYSYYTRDTTYTPDSTLMTYSGVMQTSDTSFTGLYSRAPYNFSIKAVTEPVSEEPEVAVTIGTQPANVSMTYGNDNKQFSVAATTGEDCTLSYQWQKKGSGDADFVNISGATGDTYNVPAKTPVTDTGTEYRCVVTATRTSDSATATVNSTAATLNVAPRGVTIDGVTAEDKVYDRTDTATPGGAPVINGLLDGDTVTVTTGTAAFDDENVGEDKTVTFSDYGLTGADAGNYNLTTQPANTTAKITKKDVTITGLGASSKTYDGTTDATVTGTAAIDGKVDGDTVTVQAGTAAFNNKNVGNGKAVTFSGYQLQGADAGNYNLAAQPANTTANITAKGVTVTWSNTSLTYTGSAQAPTATLGSGQIISGDTVSVTVSGAQTNVGDYTATATLTGADAGNYNLTNDEQSFSIAEASMAVTANGYTGTYDGAAHGITVNAPDGATVTYSETQNGTYSAANPSYTDAGEYTVYYKVAKAGSADVTGSATVSIAKKAVTVTGLSAANKTYDGTTAATVTGTATISGKVDGDTVTVKAGTAAFNNENVGTGKTVTFSGYQLQGADAGNYNLTAQPASVTANITAKGVTVTWSNTSLTYNGSAQAPTATLGSGQIISGDTVSVNVSGAQTDVGNYTATASLTGADAGNYNLTNDEQYFSIAEASMAVTANGYTGTYDGAAHGITVTAPDGATVTYSETQNGTYSAANPSYTDAGEYTVYYKVAKAGSADVTGSATVSIAKKDVTITGLSAANKTYDGTTAATVTGTATISGKVDGDTVTVKAGTATFNNKNVGTGKTVTFSGYQLQGTDAGNYNLTAQPASVTANITKKDVTITGLSASNKTYDGTAAATVTGTATISGKVDGDTVTVQAGTAAFNNKNVGTGKTVTFSGYQLQGTDAGNYNLAAQPANTTANITAKDVTVTWSNTSLTYNGSAQAPTATLGSGQIVSGDTVSVTVSGAQTNVGDYTATATLTGTDAGNYNLTNGSQSFSIAEAPVNAATPTVNTLTAATYTEGDTPTVLDATATVTDGGTVTYQWYRNTKNDTTDGTAIPGATGSTYTPPTDEAGEWWYYVVVTNTNNAATGTKTTTVTSSAVKITVSAAQPGTDEPQSGTAGASLIPYLKLVARRILGKPIDPLEVMALMSQAEQQKVADAFTAAMDAKAEADAKQAAADKALAQAIQPSLGANPTDRQVQVVLANTGALQQQQALASSAAAQAAKAESDAARKEYYARNAVASSIDRALRNVDIATAVALAENG